MTTAAPFGQPLYVMLKPAGPMCNLACHYCYYLEKRELYPTDKHPTMSKELLEEFTRLSDRNTSWLIDDERHLADR